MIRVLPEQLGVMEAAAYWAKSGTRHIRRPDAESVWLKHQESVVDRPDIYANHPDEEIAVAALAGPIRSKALKRKGTVGANRAKVRAAQEKLRQLSTERVLVELAKGETVMTPLFAELMERSAKTERDSDTTTERPELDPRIHEYVTRFQKYVSENVGIDEFNRIGGARGFEGQRAVWGEIMRHTRAAARPEGVAYIANNLTEARAVQLLENRFLTKENFQDLADWVIKTAKQRGDLKEHERASWAGEFFVRARELGWKLSTLQVEMAKEATLGQVDQEIVSVMSGVSDVLSDRKCRRYILRTLDEKLWPQFLNAAQGAAWLDIVTEGCTPASVEKKREELLEEIGKATKWNLEGITCEDLLPLVGNDEAAVRLAIHKLMVRVDTMKTEEDAPKARQGKGPRRM